MDVKGPGSVLFEFDGKCLSFGGLLNAPNGTVIQCTGKYNTTGGQPAIFGYKQGTVQTGSYFVQWITSDFANLPAGCTVHFDLNALDSHGNVDSNVVGKGWYSIPDTLEIYQVADLTLTS